MEIIFLFPLSLCFVLSVWPLLCPHSVTFANRRLHLLSLCVSLCVPSDPNALGQHGTDHALIGGVVAVVVFVTLCLIIVLGRYLARHKGKTTVGKDPRRMSYFSLQTSKSLPFSQITGGGANSSDGRL